MFFKTKPDASPIDEFAACQAEANKLNAAAEAARSKRDADRANLARLESNVDLKPNATDDEIVKHLERVSVARVKVDLSTRAAEAAEAAAREAASAAEVKAYSAHLARAAADQAKIVERFREEYPRLVGELLALFAEAHAIEIGGGRLTQRAPEGAESFVSQFKFSSPFSPADVRIEVRDAGGNALWVGNIESDLASVVTF